MAVWTRGVIFDTRVRRPWTLPVDMVSKMMPMSTCWTQLVDMGTVYLDIL